MSVPGPAWRIEPAALSVIRHFQARARKGTPETRRDWLYGPAHVPPGHWNQEGLLDVTLRRAKDIGAGFGFELVYVYWRPPVWTCQPSDEVRAYALLMEIKREATAEERIARCAPTGSSVALIAHGLASTLRASAVMLQATFVLDAGPPANDPCIARIDAIPGLAN